MDGHTQQLTPASHTLTRPSLAADCTEVLFISRYGGIIGSGTYVWKAGTTIAVIPNDDATWYFTDQCGDERQALTYDTDTGEPKLTLASGPAERARYRNTHIICKAWYDRLQLVYADIPKRQ